MVDMGGAGGGDFWSALSSGLGSVGRAPSTNISQQTGITFNPTITVSSPGAASYPSGGSDLASSIIPERGASLPSMGLGSGLGENVNMDLLRAGNQNNSMMWLVLIGAGAFLLLSKK